MSREIKQITIVSAPGVKVYEIGGKIWGTDNVVHEIKIAPVYFTGDPFDHYCGYDITGKLIFTVHPSTPCEVVYC